MYIRYKARLVIKGYEQTDFGETHTPVRKLTTLRYLISLVERCGCNVDHVECSQNLNSHGSKYRTRLCRRSGGEGTRQGQCQALSSDHRIIDVRSTCNAARYIICSRCSQPIQYPSIHQPYDRGKESAPVAISKPLAQEKHTKFTKGMGLW